LICGASKFENSKFRETEKLEKHDSTNAHGPLFDQPPGSKNMYDVDRFVEANKPKQNSPFSPL
jgi:hypothetical protein